MSNIPPNINDNNNTENEKIDLKKVGYLKNLSNEIIERYRLKKGDLLFSNINSDFHLGKTAIYSLDNLLLHGKNLLLIRPNNKIIDSHFLNYLFNYFRFSGIFISIAQHAVNQSSINQTKLISLEIPLPPLNEQKRIVSKLEELFTKLDAGIEYLKKTQILLKQYRQSVLKYAFEGKLVPQDQNDEQAEVLLKKIKNERELTVTVKKEKSKITKKKSIDNDSKQMRLM